MSRRLVIGDPVPLELQPRRLRRLSDKPGFGKEGEMPMDIGMKDADRKAIAGAIEKAVKNGANADEVTAYVKSVLDAIEAPPGPEGESFTAAARRLKITDAELAHLRDLAARYGRRDGRVTTSLLQRFAESRAQRRSVQ